MKFLMLFLVSLLVQKSFGQSNTSIKNDPDLVKYRRIHNKIESNILSHHYQLPNNRAYQNDMAKAKSPDELKAILAKYGMQNSNEYVDDVISQNKAMAAFIKNHPELTKLNPMDFRTKLAELLNN